METSNPHNLAFLEGLYEQYTRDPGSVPEDYRGYFAQLGNGHPFKAAPSFRRRSIFDPSGSQEGAPSSAGAAAGAITESGLLQERVSQLVRNYRVRGHNVAKLDPLERPRPRLPELDPFSMGFSEADLGRTFSTAYVGGPEAQTLGQILQRLRNTYCRSIGAQFMHIDDVAVRQWLQERMEGCENHIKLERAEQLRILRRLTDAVVFESFLQKKFLGAKTFSLEGAETLIPLLDMAIEKAGAQDVDEVVIGMAHRGRLNVLANIIGKSPQEIFREFEDLDPQKHLGGGDVKYHLGYSGDRVTQTGHKVHLSLCFNPSHLEYINAVAMGRMRAKQDRVGDADRRRGLVILIHGDASFAGEGVVQETLNQSQLPGYFVGGALHVVVNNQVGFTTLPHQARSSIYATDVARMLQSPVFHVNGEDPEAVAQVIRLAMDFRAEFRRDVFIDMYCFRRRGHNEGDEPSFTQPLMYQTIEKRPSVREGYLRRMMEMGGVTREEGDALERKRVEALEAALSDARAGNVQNQDSMQGVWKPYRGGPDSDTPDVETGVSREELVALLESMTTLPEGFQPHPKIVRFLESRSGVILGEKPIDWTTGEALALASVAAGGARIRMSGQDCERGTFSQRHAVLHDVSDGHTHCVLHGLGEHAGPVEVVNSPLAEAGVLGFEYGYSLDCPDGLVLWEAQFGDFVNCAQVILDQFIASAESKWKRLSGIVLLLPHGFEGQGPEHSSARLERFLQLCAQDNLQVCYPSTPAQYFHLLRRQVVRPWRKPLVVMTPKSLLRLPECVSRIEEMSGGRFRRVIGDPSTHPKRATRVLLCTGKVYYDLVKERAEKKRDDVAIVRVEQLYPFPEKELREALGAYPDGTPAVWVQEEPRNMGAWIFLQSRLGLRVAERFPLSGVARPESASPATGSPGAHKIEARNLLDAAFGTRE